MEKLPRVILFDLEDEKGAFYAISEKNSYYEGILLSASTGIVVGQEAIMPICNTKIYLGDIEPEWQEIIDCYNEKQMILNSSEPVGEYLASKNNSDRAELREMEKDSEPFTVTESETKGSACVEEMLTSEMPKGAVDWEGIAKKQYKQAAELKQYIDDLESECEYLREEVREKDAIIKHYVERTS